MLREREDEDDEVASMVQETVNGSGVVGGVLREISRPKVMCSQEKRDCSEGGARLQAEMC